MSGGTARRAIGELQALFRFGVVADLGDGQLLDRFVSRRDEGGEEAFAMLVRRHGPMVFGVCRRVLGSPHEAEDAFQATFLVLARKAGTIAGRDTLTNWLYGVALRTAKDARSRALRRRAWEERSRHLRVVRAGEDHSVRELRQLLDEELARLPARFRAPLLLCELESLSRQEAAHRLGIPEGTLSSRLARAKRLLRDRLTRRGLGLPAGLLAAGLISEGKADMVSAAVVESTIRAATLVAAGYPVTGLLTASVYSLMEEVLTAMLYAKLKGIAIAMVAAGAVVTGALVLAQDAAPRAENPQPKGAPDVFTATTIAPAAGSAAREDSQTQLEASEVYLTRSDPDRLGALGHKLDRILEALGSQRTPAVAAQATSNFGAPTRATSHPLSPSNRLNGFSPIAGETTPAPARADRLAGLERRMADLERRMADLERRANQTGQAATSIPSSATPGPN